MKLRDMLIGLGCALLLASPCLAQPAISGLSIAPGENGAEEVHFAASGSVAPKKLFTLAGPDRVVIDLPVLAQATSPPPPATRWSAPYASAASTATRRASSSTSPRR
ncbi:MAG: hypothetical protein WDN72_03315 [Alphaproteobacteria bacterium]